MPYANLMTILYCAKRRQHRERRLPALCPRRRRGPSENRVSGCRTLAPRGTRRASQQESPSPVGIFPLTNRSATLRVGLVTFLPLGDALTTSFFQRWSAPPLLTVDATVQDVCSARFQRAFPARPEYALFGPERLEGSRVKPECFSSVSHVENNDRITSI